MNIIKPKYPRLEYIFWVFGILRLQIYLIWAQTYIRTHLISCWLMDECFIWLTFHLIELIIRSYRYSWLIRSSSLPYYWCIYYIRFCPYINVLLMYSVFNVTKISKQISQINRARPLNNNLKWYTNKYPRVYI